MKTFEQIRADKERLNNELLKATSIMVYNNDIKRIRAEILANQQACPHIANYTICPYCGKKCED